MGGKSSKRGTTKKKDGWGKRLNYQGELEIGFVRSSTWIIKKGNHRCPRRNIKSMKNEEREGCMRTWGREYLKVMQKPSIIIRFPVRDSHEHL